MHAIATKTRTNARRRTAFAAAGLSLWFLSSCASNAITERPQLMLVSEEKVMAVSNGAYADMVEEARARHTLNPDPQTTERVRRIASRLIAEAAKYRPTIADWKWEVNVFRSKAPNAFCMAGGKIAVSSELLGILQPGDDELAQILGHEIAHALSGHSREKISNALASRLLLSAVAGSQRIDRVFTQPIRGAVEEAVTAPHSRKTELEADKIGIVIAANAGIDPNAAVSLWEKVRVLQGDEPASFSNTHPPAGERIAALQAEVQTLMPVYREVLEKSNRSAQ